MAVDLPRAKAHLRVDFDTDDALIAAYLAGAIGAVERQTGRILAAREMVQRFDRWTDAQGRERLTLSHDPVVSVEGVDYVDGDGAVQELLPETVPGDGGFRTVAGEPYLLLSPADASFPALADQPGAVSVRYTAGYGGDAGDAPAELDAAVLLMVGHFYANREAAGSGTISFELPLGVRDLCFPFRRVLLG